MIVAPFLEESSLKVGSTSHRVADAGKKLVSILGGFEQRIAEIQQEMRDIESLGLCCGKIEIRKKGSGMAVHSAKMRCPHPAHSREKKTVGRGVRKYVSKADIPEMQDCQERWVKWKALDDELNQYTSDYARIETTLLRALSYASKAILK